MNDACNRGLRAGTEIRSSARNSTSHRNSTDQRDQNIGGSLRDQFGVGVVAIAAERIRDHGRKQAFYGGQDRDRERRRQQRKNKVGPKRRDVNRRKAT